jgi:transcriptional regulator with XRE-family HTH domain
MNKLRESRISQRITQAQLASLTGLSQAYINELEKGKKRNPTIAVLSRLGCALGIPLSQLLKNECRAGTSAKIPEDNPEIKKNDIVRIKL